MTTFSEAREAVFQTFSQEWGNATDFTLDNEEFTPEGDAWVRLSVKHRDAYQSSLGDETNRKFERKGAAFVQIFTRTNTGTAKSAELVEKVQAMFEGKRINGTTICFLEVKPKEIGPEGIWFNVTVEAIFSYQEIK